MGERTRKDGKLPPKKKKVKVWCEGGGQQVIAKRRLLPGKNNFDEPENEKSPSKQRCPYCNKRLTPKRIIDDFDGQHLFYRLPKHKAK